MLNNKNNSHNPREEEHLTYNSNHLLNPQQSQSFPFRRPSIFDYAENNDGTFNNNDKEFGTYSTTNNFTANSNNNNNNNIRIPTFQITTFQDETELEKNNNNNTEQQCPDHLHLLLLNNNYRISRVPSEKRVEFSIGSFKLSQQPNQQLNSVRPKSALKRQYNYK